jgi:hypothetical protein
MIGGFTTADLLPGQQGQVVYDVDGANSTASDVMAIHAAGAIAVCYVDVGTLEMGRPDYAEFPSSVVGPPVQGWPGENWLLVTAANQATLLPRASTPSSRTTSTRGPTSPTSPRPTTSPTIWPSESSPTRCLSPSG